TRSKRDWSSDVCSSDLAIRQGFLVLCNTKISETPEIVGLRILGSFLQHGRHVGDDLSVFPLRLVQGCPFLEGINAAIVNFDRFEIGRASCRERGSCVVW